MPKIHFVNKKRVVEAARGSSVLEAALEHKVSLYHTCGGNASCSTCRVHVLAGAGHLSPVEDVEAQVLDAFDLKPPTRLACQAMLLGGDVDVEIPDRSKPCRDNKTPRLSQGVRGTY